MLWYPIKEVDKFQTHLHNLKKSNVPMVLFELEPPSNIPSSIQNGLKKTAVIVFNPPQLLLDRQNEIHNLNLLLFKEKI
jgi:23S rRNA A2030 N6-methylase RlmJ